MIIGKPFTPTPADHLEIETEQLRAEAEQRALNAELESSGIRRFIEVRDGGRFMQAKRLNAHIMAGMEQIERRLLAEWIEAAVAELTEKERMLRRNTRVEAEVPEALRVRA